MNPSPIAWARMRAWIAALAVAVPLSAQYTAPGVPSSPSPLAPPSSIWQTGSPTVRFDPTIYRDANCRPLEKIVSFEWRFTNAELPSATNLRDQVAEVFATRYWPTFVFPLDGYHLVVAGKATNGDSVLEAWTFATASALGTPAPSVSVAQSTSGGSPIFSWTMPPRVQVDEVLRLPSGSAHGLIRGLLRDRHSPTRIYVYLDASRELINVNLVTRAFHVVASPLVIAQSLHVPALTNGYQRYWTADYANRGYCYLFAPLTKPPVGPTPLILALIDSDRDGKLDESRLVSGTDWITDGWSDPANHIQSD